MIVAYQLYSSRNFGPVSQTLKMLSDLGVSHVEGYGGLFETAAELDMLKASLEQFSLRMPSAHLGLEAVENAPATVIGTAKALGIARTFIPYLDVADRPSTRDGWSDFGARLTKAAKPLSEAGLAVGWHNHDFEFQPLTDGTYPIDVLLDAAPDLSFEFDVAWAVRAGEDPKHWINRLGSRITAAHVKDIAPTGNATDEDGWADLGQGTVDWPDLLDHLRAQGCDLFVLEHDNPSDDRRFARNSHDFIAAYEART